MRAVADIDYPPQTETRTSVASATRAAALALEGVSRRYGGRLAVDGVSWSARPGETVCLLGHSGCGKTTLLRLIAGLEQPGAGRILIDGEAVSSGAHFRPPEQRRIGLVFQDYALFPHLSVLDNVCFGLRGRDLRSTALQALERVRMAHHANSYPHTLSGGEQQRVALARALAPQPRLLLMDEPFSNLDRRLRDRVRDETMALLRETGTTAVVVTHDPEEALRIADRIVLMRAGRVEQVGHGEEVYRRPANLFAARFFSDFNEITGICRDGAVALPLGRFPAPGFAEGSDVRLCLRPQALRIARQPSGCTGTVLECLFLGEAEQLRIAVEGLAQPLLMRGFEASGARPGDRVHLTVEADGALLFPDSD